MPTVLLVRGVGTSDTTLPALLEAMAEEVTTARVGAATVLTRLADVVLVRILRAWMESQPEDSTGWLAALRDPKIGKAIAAIHRQPGNPWSVKLLATIATTSRSTFAERFASLVGMPVARYIATWRMHLASRWLRNDRIRVAEAAARLGYESEASFSRAFKRLHGYPPSKLRSRDEMSPTLSRGRRR
jgi:AraC-like DNA-binding protein